VRLVRLRLRGYRRLRDLELDLDHPRLLIVGPNEAGKSTLMESLMTGLYGLAPGKRGSGHTAALKDVAPWSGQAAGLSLEYRLDGGRVVEADWDLTGETTRVIDHQAGEDITATFEGGTHGWVDVGYQLLGLPGTVFQQFTCVGEGELAALRDDSEIRSSLLRLSDSGADVLVEQAIHRLEEAVRQSTIPKVNAATRRNGLARDLAETEGKLNDARRARDELENEIGTIESTERELEQLRDDLAAMLAEEERRQGERRRISSEIDRARGRLAEAELRFASLSSDSRDGAPAAQDPDWSEEEMERARQLLIAPEGTGKRSAGTLATAGILCVAGVFLLAAGIYLGEPFLDAAGLLVAAIGVLAGTRGGLAPGEDLKVGPIRFANRQALMVALDGQRARRDLRDQAASVEQLNAQLQGLLTESLGLAPEGEWAEGTPLLGIPDVQLEKRVAWIRGRHLELSAKLERQRGSLERGSSLIAEVAPLEERAATLRASIETLEAFGAAARMAAEHLGTASEEIRRAYAPRLEKYLSRDLPRITGGRYGEAVVNERFEVMLRAPETGSMVEMGRLSRGTQQQVYLLLRLGLLDLVARSGESLPLLLDDALALSDDTRRAEILRVLEEEERQVIYFTARESTAAMSFGPVWHRVELPAPQGAQAEVPRLEVLESPV
jgi:uncharacterized protein YhaN